MNLIDKAIEQAFESHARHIKQLHERREPLRMAEAFVARFGGGVQEWAIPDYGVWIEIPIDSFAEVEPMIQFIEDWRPLGVECVRTEDEPSNGVRNYLFAAPGSRYVSQFSAACRLVLKGCIKADATGCRRVIVGYDVPEPSPKYAIECNGVIVGSESEPGVLLVPDYDPSDIPF